MFTGTQLSAVTARVLATSTARVLATGPWASQQSHNLSASSTGNKYYVVPLLVVVGSSATVAHCQPRWLRQCLIVAGQYCQATTGGLAAGVGATNGC